MPTGYPWKYWCPKVAIGYEKKEARKDIQNFVTATDIAWRPQETRPKFVPPPLASDKPRRPYDLFDFLDAAAEESYRIYGRKLPIVSTAKLHHQPTKTKTDINQTEAGNANEGTSTSTQTKESDKVKVKVGGKAHGKYRYLKRMGKAANARNLTCINSESVRRRVVKVHHWKI